MSYELTDLGKKVSKGSFKNGVRCCFYCDRVEFIIISQPDDDFLRISCVHCGKDYYLEQDIVTKKWTMEVVKL